MTRNCMSAALSARQSETASATRKKSGLHRRKTSGSITPGVFAFHEKMEKGEVRLDLENLKKITFRHSLPKEGYLFSHCGAGVNEYAIDWAGRMMACELLSDGFTYPFEEGFEKAWERLPEIYPQSRVPEKCRDCPDAAFCDTCPANRLAETGDWFGCPDYACREAAYFHQLLKDMKIV